MNNPQFDVQLLILEKKIAHIVYFYKLTLVNQMCQNSVHLGQHKVNPTVALDFIATCTKCPGCEFKCVRVDTKKNQSIHLGQILTAFTI